MVDEGPSMSEQSKVNNPSSPSLMWKCFVVQFVRENCHHHRSNIRLGERGRHEPESEGGPGHSGLQVRRRAESSQRVLTDLLLAGLLLFPQLSLAISYWEHIEEDHTVTLDHSSVINIWLLSYSVSNYRDVVKGHEVAGGIKSETQVIDV